MVKLIVPPNVIGTCRADAVIGEEKANTSAIGIQVLNEGIINTYSGKDTITGTGTLTSTDGSATGIFNRGMIKSGNGDDKIRGIASRTNLSPGNNSNLIGIENLSGIITTGSGDDSIIGIGTGGFADIGIFNTGNGVINTGDGDDKIIGTGICKVKDGNVGSGIYLNSGSLIDTGKGNDSIIGTGITNNGNAGRGIQIFDSAIKAGDGDDSIIGTTTASQAIGITNVGGNISGGNGNDLIIGTGIDVGEVIGYGINNTNFFDEDEDFIKGTIDGGDGDDSIIGIGISSNLGIGINNSLGQIDGGKGNDKIFGYGTNVGIQGGSATIIGIDGGIGNDYFKSRKVDGLDADGNSIESANQGGSISNILIAGGKGNDIYDVGYGNATLDGGQGFDTLILLGSSNNYSIQNSNGSSTFVRDGYTLTVLNIENIVFASEPLGAFIV
nr:calcium-binding protein [Nostoc sp. EkiNYC01]